MARPESDLSLRTRALSILARREHTRAELARKLAAFSDSQEEVERLLDELARRKLLSDERYAEARAHTLGRKFGSARVEHELRSRGVSEPAAAAVLDRLRETELERARVVWRKRFGRPPSDALERAKQMRFLQARGFSFDVIRAVLAAAAEDD